MEGWGGRAKNTTSNNNNNTSLFLHGLAKCMIHRNNKLISISNDSNHNLPPAQPLPDGCVILTSGQR